MNFLGIEVCGTLIKAAIAFFIVGSVIVLSLIKLYCYVTCGYCRSRARMEGKTVIITGANSGIGKETAREIAKRGARVILACRNLETANEAKGKLKLCKLKIQAKIQKTILDDIIKTTGNQNVIVKKLDLSSQKSIREFAEDIKKTEPKLDVLVHNAGTAETRTKVTEDGLEMTMATNHFGPFLLTHLLIGKTLQ